MCNEVENLFERYNDAKKELEYHKKEAERLEKDVEYLEQEIHQMQDGFSKLAGEAQDSGEKVEYHKFAEDVQKKMDEKDELIKEVREENRYLRRRIGELNHEIMELCGQINKKDELINELEEIVENHRQMIRKNRDEKMDLTEEVNKQAECLREKESNISDLEACLKVARSEIEKLYTEKDEHIEELDHELGVASTENERLRNGVEFLKECIKHSDARISDLEADLKAANEKSRDISSKNSFLLRRIRVLKKQLDDCELINENLKTNLESIQLQADSWEKAAIENFERAATYANALEDAKVENESLRKCIEEKDERIKALEPLGAIDAHELLKDYRSFHDEIKELKEENESLKREVDIWKEGARKNVDSLAETYKKLEDKNKLIDYMRDKNDKIEKYVDKLNCDIAQKDKQIEKLNKELAIARVGSQACIDEDIHNSIIRVKSIVEAFKAIDEAIKKLDEEN